MMNVNVIQYNINFIHLTLHIMLHEWCQEIATKR
jgi:hypothetical protein